MLKATFVRSEDTADHIKTFWFEPEKPIHFVAGQFTELYLPHPNADERGVKHWFTISASPTDKLISITTKFAAEHGSTFKQTLAALQPGAIVDIAEPMGDFVLPKDMTIPLVFIGGGIGITPFHSMSKWLQDTDEQRNIRMLYAANHLEEVAFRDLFESVTQDLKIILSDPPADWRGLTGHLTAEKIQELIPDLIAQRIYISGPEPMVEVLGEDLEKQGIPKENLVIDYFPGYTPI